MVGLPFAPEQCVAAASSLVTKSTGFAASTATTSSMTW
jgi:hypothetical protein